MSSHWNNEIRKVFVYKYVENNKKKFSQQHSQILGDRTVGLVNIDTAVSGKFNYYSINRTFGFVTSNMSDLKLQFQSLSILYLLHIF